MSPHRPWTRGGRPAIRALRAAVWTAALFAALLGADRLLLGPEPPVGWQRAESLEDVPPELGALVPSYLPEMLGWPPRLIAWKPDPDGGWWLRLASYGSEQVWIGAGPVPPEHPAPGCLDDRGCPAGWHTLSRRIDDRAVSIVTTLRPQAARRILEGLRRP